MSTAWAIANPAMASAITSTVQCVVPFLTSCTSVPSSRGAASPHTAASPCAASAGGLAQDQYVRVGRQRPGQPEPLLLPAGELAAAAFDVAVEPDVVHEILGAGRVQGRPELFGREVGTAGQLVAEPPGEQPVGVGRDEDAAPYGLHRDVAQAHHAPGHLAAGEPA